MALIREFTMIHKESSRVHDPVECGWAIVESTGPDTFSSIPMGPLRDRYRAR